MPLRRVACEPAIEVVLPTVVWANEALSDAAGALRRHRRAPVTAGVVKCVQHAVLRSRDNEACAVRGGPRRVRSRIAKRRRAACQLPARREHSSQLGGVRLARCVPACRGHVRLCKRCSRRATRPGLHATEPKRRLAAAGSGGACAGAANATVASVRTTIYQEEVATVATPVAAALPSRRAGEHRRGGRAPFERCRTLCLRNCLWGW